MSPTVNAQTYDKDHPLFTRVIENRSLSGPRSTKDARHFRIAIGGSGLTYAAGDSLGIHPTNRVAEVDEILRRLGASGWELVHVPRGTEAVPLREALLTKLTFSGPTRKVLEAIAEGTADAGERSRIDALLGDGEALERYLSERHFVDLLVEFPGARLGAQEFVNLLRRLSPRLYSIASSPLLYPDEVHLAVSVVRYTANERERHGVCSTYLADRVALGETPVMVFVATSHFRLPDDPWRDVIMVGPGVGVAPFRAFLQERAASGAPGRNWLFFGDQRRSSDFLYEDELEAWRASGHLNRIDLAFSRDQEERIYVQHRMMEQAADLWRWVEGGASIYVCGDAQQMAKGVDAALHRIAVEQGGLTLEAAGDYIKALRKGRRYQRDVY